MKKIIFCFSFVTILVAQEAPYSEIFDGFPSDEAWDAYQTIYSKPISALSYDAAPTSPLSGVKIFSWLDVDEFRLFRAAYQNTFENKDIENRNNYRIIGNEFDYEKLKPIFADYRKRKYIAVTWPYFGQYDFKKQCMPMTEPYVATSGYADEPNMLTHLFYLDDDSGRNETGYPTLRRKLCLKIPPSVAETYFNSRELKLADINRTPLVVFKVKAEVYKPFKCNRISDIVTRAQCKTDKWETQKVKRIVLEPMRYYANINGSIFKNY